jgi:hypothetical protein
MGGLGSGSWHRFDKKSTVEDSLTLAIGDFRDRIYPDSSGAFTWPSVGGNGPSIGYFVTWDEAPTVTLHYCWRDREYVRIPVDLESTPTQFGGQRWWFTCPLIVCGAPCIRRVGKLYLPPGERYFGCRKCHDLTYRSCQEAHQEERLFASIGRTEKWLDTLKSRQR